jgi:hypothetical protein
LLLIGVGNYLPTKYALCGALICAAQCLLLRGYLPATEIALDSAAGATRVWLALTLTALASLLGLVGWPRSRSGKSPWDCLWIDFRNAYGIVWSLRIEERLNASLIATGSQTRLGWNGFEIATLSSQDSFIEKASSELQFADATKNAEPEDVAARPALVALMRRFVSKDWIAKRVDAD